MQMNKNKKKVILWIFLFLLLLGECLTGCGAKEQISLEEISDEKQEEQDATGISNNQAQSEKDEAEAPDGIAAAEGETKAAAGMFSVYVCGAVNTPGVYELPAGSRLYQAVNAAGGMREDADENYLNLASELSDGEKIQVPTKQEVQNGFTEAGPSAGSSSDGKEPASAEGLVNINTADEMLLMTLTGIGEAKAKSIIAYRKEQGAFSKIEDIMNIPGIKQTVFEKIKDRICVQ